MPEKDAMTKPRKLSPRRAAEETLALLRSQANAKRAASYQRYFKEPVDYFGLDTQGARQIKLGLLDRVEASWTIRDAVRFCDAMIRDPHMESRGIGYQTMLKLIVREHLHKY